MTEEGMREGMQKSDPVARQNCLGPSQEGFPLLRIYATKNMGRCLGGQRTTCSAWTRSWLANRSPPLPGDLRENARKSITEEGMEGE